MSSAKSQEGSLCTPNQPQHLTEEHSQEKSSGALHCPALEGRKFLIQKGLEKALSVSLWQWIPTTGNSTFINIKRYFQLSPFGGWANLLASSGGSPDYQMQMIAVPQEKIIRFKKKRKNYKVQTVNSTKVGKTCSQNVQPDSNIAKDFLILSLNSLLTSSIL